MRKIGLKNKNFYKEKSSKIRRKLRWCNIWLKEF